MSSAILRRNSSKQGLQNLLKVTAQRSMEDAEEVERERRRRAREAFRRTSSNPGPGESSQDYEMSAEDSLYDGNLKPSSSPSLEEDEGFSDWTQRREKRRQQRMQELSQGAEEEEKALSGAAMNAVNGAVSEKPLMATVTSSTRLQRQQKEQEDAEQPRMASERRMDLGEEALRADRARREKEREEEEQKEREEERRLSKKREELQRPETGVEKRKELKVSYTSKVFLHQEAKHSNTNGDAAGMDVSSCIKTKRAISGRPVVQAAEPDEGEAIMEAEQRLEKIRRSHQEKESQELEQLRHRQVEAEQELEELKKKREERRRIREEEERRREEQEQQRLAKEEEEKRRMKEDIERRRLEAAERMKTLSTSSVEGDEMFSPLSPKGPTHKITERTESLNRSLRKSNSFKKTQPPVLLSRIDDKLEQYTHAIENLQEARTAKQGLMDIPSSPEAVASKKNLFEAGEACSQSPTKGTPSKDTEGLKVGVADLITQWVKGNPDGSGKQSPSRPTDVKPGDVMQKKNMWEIIGDTSVRSGQRVRGTPSGKRYKFVVTGHGKYEKMPVDDENGDEYSNGKSDLCQGDY